MVDVMVITKSGAALVCGHRMPRPPDLSPSWLMSRAYLSGIDGLSRSVARKFLMISSVAEVRGPCHSSQGGSG
jgi:hypothetical protein